MLDKTSEKVLKSIICKCTNVDEFIDISPNQIGVSYSLFNSVAEDLRQKQLINSFYYCRSDNDSADVHLSYKGYSYFEYKKLAKRELLKNSIIIPISVTLITQIALYLSKFSLPYLADLINSLFKS